MRELEDEGEKRAAIELLSVKYAPADSPAHREETIRREWGPLCMLEMEIHHLTGKRAKELVQGRSCSAEE